MSSDMMDICESTEEEDLSLDLQLHGRKRPRTAANQGIMQKKEADCWWGVALLIRTAGSVTVSLIDVDGGGQRVLPCAATLSVQGAGHMNFALVESKLYGFGCSPDVINESSNDFYVCDLKGADFNADRSYEFRRQGKLISPKPDPVVVPYEKKKIFIIATGFGERQTVRPPFCEVLKLPSLIPYKIKTPFDKAYGTDSDPYVLWSDAHFVQGHKLYLQLVSKSWGFKPRIFCLDMINDQWLVCNDLHYERYCKADMWDFYPEPLPSFMFSFYENWQWQHLNNVVGDILFISGFAYEEEADKGNDPPSGQAPKGKIFVRAVNVEDICPPLCDYTSYFPPLEGLEAYLSELFPDPDPYSCFPGWVVPLDLDDNLFYFFMSINGNLVACKFQLRRGKSIPVEVGHCNYMGPGHSTSCYDCEVLCHQFVRSTIKGFPLCAFSREGCHRFNFRIHPAVL